jgi:hypothetical protein
MPTTDELCHEYHSGDGSSSVSINTLDTGEREGRYTEHPELR